MRSACTVLALAFGLVLVAASARSASRVSLERPLQSAPHGWVRGERAHRHDAIDLHVFVKQQNTDMLETILLRVADPTSPDYGKHLSLDQVNKLIAPSHTTRGAVLAWLRAHGIDTLGSLTATDCMDIITIRTEVHVAEALLDAEYYHFTHSASGHSVIRTLRYSVPAEMETHLDFIGPTSRFPVIQRMRSRPRAVPRTKRLVRRQRPRDDDGVTPDMLRSLYNVGSYRSTNKNNSAAIASFLEQYMDQSDLDSFFSQFAPSSSGQQPTIVGPNDPTNPGIEAMLDIEYIMAVAADAPTQFWYTAGRQPKNPENEPFLVWLQNVSSLASAPLVFSISYGDNEDTVDPDYASRVNTEFMKAGVRGISLMSASGDGGVSGSQPSACTTFIPTFPAVSPYITAVGGSTGSTLPETAAELSGGGFSNYFARPTWQAPFVQDYFAVAQGLPDPSLYNNTGAGFPDVAAQAQDFNIVVSGFTQAVDGTSCATPTFSAVVALLNDVRLNAGKSSLGYLNLLFYQNPQAFNDITTGSNPGCNTNGFPAAAGWDPVTGLGSPNFAALVSIIKRLP